MALIAEKRPDLTYLAPEEVHVKWDQCLGEGGFCTAYRAEWEGGGEQHAFDIEFLGTLFFSLSNDPPPIPRSPTSPV